jgi:predicted ATPase
VGGGTFLPGGRSRGKSHRRPLPRRARLADEPGGALRDGAQRRGAGRDPGIRFWDADLLRIEGEILLQRDLEADPDAAEWLLAQAVETAREQGARSLELRAATSLARLWWRRGEPERGRELLAPVRSGFAGGFETPDLAAADALLEGGGEGR